MKPEKNKRLVEMAGEYLYDTGVTSTARTDQVGRKTCASRYYS